MKANIGDLKELMKIPNPFKSLNLTERFKRKHGICPECDGYGQHGTRTDDGITVEQTFTRCERCKGTGFIGDDSHFDVGLNREEDE